MTELTRRNVLSGVAVTAATAVGSVELAAAPAANNPEDVQLFVNLSGALTGIDAAKLAPTVDPVQVKTDYFNQAKQHEDFDAVMKIVRADPNPKNPTAAADKIMNDPKLKFLGRSIILMWYLGAWYPPADLAKSGPHSAEKIVSEKAYTQAWTWRVAQTHPMGYSEWRFGYWAEEPPPLNSFIKA